MAYLLRQTRQRIWKDRDREAALENFGRRDVDSDGVSLFSAASDEEELLVVAAYACEKCEGPGKLDLLHLSDDEIAPFGVVTAIPGSMAVRTVNGLHRVLDWSAAALEGLVDALLASARESKRYDTKTVRDAVRALDPDDVEEGRHREWVLKVKQGGGR